MKLFSRVLFLATLSLLTQLIAEGGEPYIKYADLIIQSFEKECAKEFKKYKLRSIGSGGGMAYDVEEIRVMFFAYRPATIEEARVLETSLTEKLLKKINENEKIRPYLREYPFKANRARVSVSFHKPNSSVYTDGSVAYVLQAKGQILYCAADPKTEDYYDLHEEPYEEALKLVQK